MILKISFESKYQVRLVVKSLLFTALIIAGSSLIVSGFLYLDIYGTYSNLQRPIIEMEEKEVSKYADTDMVNFIDLYLNPLKKETNQSGDKIYFSTYVQSDKLLDNFSVGIFHKELTEKYTKMMENYLSEESNKFTKFRSGAEFFINMENNNPEKCVIKNPEKESEFIIKEDCSYDYNGNILQILETPGEYYALFINEGALFQRGGYIHPLSFFTINDEKDTIVKQDRSDINYELTLQKNQNIKTEGYFFLGLGAGMLLACITIYDSIAHEKRNFNNEKLKIKRTKSLISELTYALIALKMVTIQRDDFMKEYNNNSRDKKTVKKDIDDLKSTFGLTSSALNRAETSELFDIKIEEQMRKLYRESLKDVAISDNDKYVYSIRSNKEKIEKMIEELEISLRKFEKELPDLSKKTKK